MIYFSHGRIHSHAGSLTGACFRREAGADGDTSASAAAAAPSGTAEVATTARTGEDGAAAAGERGCLCGAAFESGAEVCVLECSRAAVDGLRARHTHQ